MKKLLLKWLVWPIFFCLLWAVPAMAATAQYTYDKLNRLVQVQYDDGTIIQYSYDAVGNRLVQQVTAFTPTQTQAPVSSQTSGSITNAPLVTESQTPKSSVP